MIELLVEKEYDQIRLNKFLAKKMPKIDNSLLYKQLRKKNITVNNKKAEASLLLNEKDKVQIYFSKETFNKFSEDIEDNKFKTIKKIDIKQNDNLLKQLIVYEDENIILINKPKNLLCQKSSNDDISLNEMCIAYSKCKNGAILNRIDRNTTGIVIFGKNYLTNKIISKMIKDREIEKHYHALVEGVLDTKGKEIVIEAYLLKDEKNNKVNIFDKCVEGSRKIKTIYKTIKINKEKNISLIDINLITGAPHQIRAHLFHEGHQIVGDLKYSSGKALNKTNNTNFSSQCLHSYSIRFGEIDSDIEKLKNISNKLFRTESPEWENFV